VSIEFRELTPTDYDRLVALWEQEGVREDIACAQSQEAYESYLSHHACLSLGVTIDDQLVGAVLCGDCDNRGLIEHVTIHKDYLEHSKPSLLHLLVNRAMNKLIKHGFTKCSINIAEPSLIQEFWSAIRWTDQPDLSSCITVDKLKLEEYADLDGETACSIRRFQASVQSDVASPQGAEQGKDADTAEAIVDDPSAESQEPDPTSGQDKNAAA